MSGHSKWANIKHKKGAMDAKRGKLFSKLIREITVAAKEGGDDVGSNPRLRTAVAKAKENNMPNDNIDRAIKKGVGTLDGESFEEIRYEGYSPGGVAIMVDCVTDNKNRTTPEIRTIFNKHGGNLGETGCVSYNFERKGMITIEAGQATEDEIMELLIDFDVDDIRVDDGNIVVTSSPMGYNDIYDTLKSKGYKMGYNEVTFIPRTTVKLDENKAAKCLKLIDALDEQDDVQQVYSNYDIPDDVMLKISEEM